MDKVIKNIETLLYAIKHAETSHNANYVITKIDKELLKEALKILNKNSDLADVIDMVCRNSNCCNNDHIKKICLNQEHSKICGSRKT